jgi:glycosyltransferase involved in cell wall biosynthesis
LGKPIDVGLGPEPLINNVYHKKALESAGYSAQTFVNQVYFITNDFDIRADLILKRPFRLLRNYYLYILSIMRYKSLYIYFNGGPLGFTHFLWRIETFLYKLANVKTVVMPYGGDIDEMSRTRNLLFKNAMSRDYPTHRFRRKRIETQIDIWTKYADHIIAGCDWVEYLYHWDTLMLAHFSIDTDSWKPVDKTDDGLKWNGKNQLRILHAPNHRYIKGTKHFIDAVNSLNEEGFNIELVILEKVPNHEIKKIIASVDLVADQLIVGWYAMFALEAMAMEKPVLCYIREDLEKFYISSGLILDNELPIIKCSPVTVKETIKDLVLNRGKLAEIGKRSREYVVKHHSIESVGKVFRDINHSIGIRPEEGQS